MAVIQWIIKHGFVLLQGVGIIGSLLFTALSLRSETKTRRISNLLTVTSNHRELWSQLYDYPKLWRVVDATVDVEREPVSREEALFVTSLVLHLSSSYHAIKDGLFIKPDGLRKDFE